MIIWTLYASGQDWYPINIVIKNVKASRHFFLLFLHQLEVIFKVIRDIQLFVS